MSNSEKSIIFIFVQSLNISEASNNKVFGIELSTSIESNNKSISGFVISLLLIFVVSIKSLNSFSFGLLKIFCSYSSLGNKFIEISDFHINLIK